MNTARLTRRASLWGPVAAYMAVIFYLSSLSAPLPDLTIVVWDKALHAVEYAGLAALCARAFLGEACAPRQALMLAILTAVAYAATDELHQSGVIDREADVRDWLADSVGAMSGAGFSVAIAWLRGGR